MNLPFLPANVRRRVLVLPLTRLHDQRDACVAQRLTTHLLSVRPPALTFIVARVVYGSAVAAITSAPGGRMLLNMGPNAR
jgi:hypothetical protein